MARPSNIYFNISLMISIFYLWSHLLTYICERGRDSCCRWRPEIRENVGIQWSVTKNQFLISLGHPCPSLALHTIWGQIYFPILIRNWYLVTLHWIPAFFRISGRHLQQESRPRSHFSISNLWSQLLTYVSQFPTYDLIFWLIFLNFSQFLTYNLNICRPFWRRVQTKGREHLT